MEKEHAQTCAALNVSNPIIASRSCDCDGYHTFDELYEHRHRLFMKLCQFTLAFGNEVNVKFPVWRSKFHSDGNPAYNGWFIMGIGTEKGKQISYHIPMRLWDDRDIEHVEIREKAPEFDGHTSTDVLIRLKEL